jgi:hypothetical protein
MIFFFLAYLFFAFISGLIFLYSSFALSFGNLFLLFGVSWLMSIWAPKHQLIKSIVIFLITFGILGFMEQSIGGRNGLGFGSGSGGNPYQKHMVDGDYTYVGKIRAMKFIALGVFVYFIGEICRLVGKEAQKN